VAGVYLEVSIDNVMLVQVAHGRDDLGAVEAGARLGEALVGALHLAVQVVVEVAADRELHHKAQPVGRLEREAHALPIISIAYFAAYRSHRLAQQQHPPEFQFPQFHRIPKQC